MRTAANRFGLGYARCIVIMGLLLSSTATLANDQSGGGDAECGCPPLGGTYQLAGAGDPPPTVTITPDGAGEYSVTIGGSLLGCGVPNSSGNQIDVSLNGGYVLRFTCT